MHRIKKVVFVCGGVLIPRLSKIVSNICQSGTLLHDLTRLEHDFFLGQINAMGLMDELRTFMSSRSDDEIISAIIDKLTLTTGMIPILKSLSHSQNLQLIMDYPSDWHPKINNRIELNAFFSEENTFSIERGKTFDSYAAQMEFLINSGFLHPGNSLLIDYHSLRSSAAIRSGLDAAIFVAPDRLHRDLSSLWGLY